MNYTFTDRRHIVWADLLRIFACFLVVFSHSCDPFVGKFDANYGEFLTGALIGSFMRPSVPLFVMLSGMLLLAVNMGMTDFYKRRTKRLLLPFIFWSLALPLLYFFYVNSGVAIINPNIAVDDYTLTATLQKMYLWIINFNYDTTVLWYLYMLIGLYLFLPIIGGWLKQATQKEIQLFLGIWMVSLLLPYIQMAAPLIGYKGVWGNWAIWGACDWNPYGTLYYFSGFTGYAVLAHYLKRFPLNWSWNKTLAIAIPLLLVGYVITAGGFILTQEYFPGSFANLEIIWYFSGINVFMMTFAIYVIIQKIEMKPYPWIGKAASLTLGVFLLHFFVVQVSYDIIYPIASLPTAIKIILIALMTTTLSALIIWLMSLNKVTRKLVM